MPTLKVFFFFRYFGLYDRHRKTFLQGPWHYWAGLPLSTQLFILLYVYCIRMVQSFLTKPSEFMPWLGRNFWNSIKKLIIFRALSRYFERFLAVLTFNFSKCFPIYQLSLSFLPHNVRYFFNFLFISYYVCSGNFKLLINNVLLIYQ